MSTAKGKPRGVRVEKNVYSRERTGPNGKPQTVYEIGYRDSTGKQRWQPVPAGQGIVAARKIRDDILGRKGQGETVVPDPKVKFGVAADAWLAGPVASLRPSTRAVYTGHLDKHLRPRWSSRQLQAIQPDDVKRLIADLRAAGLSEWTITGVLGVLTQIYKGARVRLRYRGEKPMDGLWHDERPKPQARAKRRLYEGDELSHVLAVANEPFRTLFALAAVTGGRMSELLGLTWDDVTIDDPEDAQVRIEFQADRAGIRVAPKTADSGRTLPIPAALVSLLAAHKLGSGYTAPEAFVFCTRSGRALSQRNVMRELRRAQRVATDDIGRRAFTVLHVLDTDGTPVCADGRCTCEVGEVAPGTLPTFHSFRHSAATHAIRAGDSAENVAWLLGHKDANVTRAVYIHELKDAERKARLLAGMNARTGSALAAAERRNSGSEIRSVTSNVRSIH